MFCPKSCLVHDWTDFLIIPLRSMLCVNKKTNVFPLLSFVDSISTCSSICGFCSIGQGILSVPSAEAGSSSDASSFLLSARWRLCDKGAGNKCLYTIRVWLQVTGDDCWLQAVVRHVQPINAVDGEGYLGTCYPLQNSPTQSKRRQLVRTTQR